jgi:pimeloyl-ACP methyl ester carboxylesterase
MPAYTEALLDVHGCRVNLLRGGKGPPLLFLHGASGGGIWQPFHDKLAERFDVIAPEHPGWGTSDTPEWLDTIGDVAYFYLDFLKQLDLRRVHLVGLSVGGWIAAEIAVRSTERLRSLTLVSSAGLFVKDVPQIDTFLQSDEARLRDFFHDQKLADRLIGQVLSPERADIAIKNRFTTAKLIWQPRGYNPHLRKWLHRIDVPTLLLWGASDKLLPPAYGQEFNRLIPGSKLTVFPECGHLPNIEKPTEFVDAIGKFAAGVPA